MLETNPLTYYQSPLGCIRIRHRGAAPASLSFIPRKPAQGAWLKKNSGLWRQLEAYFKKGSGKFSVSLKDAGTPFQRKVWKALLSVPYGRTVSYSQIAERIGKKKSVRAVANAVGQNRLPILVPCHRVIGKDGSLTGYAYGLRKKAWLLRHERGSG